MYASPEDIDLWSAGITERPLPGSMVGPTLACLIGKQFHNFRHGDRFWYENGGWPSSFTLEQLAEIRRVKLSRVLCDNSDDLETVQVRQTPVLGCHESRDRQCHESRDETDGCPVHHITCHLVRVDVFHVIRCTLWCCQTMKSIPVCHASLEYCQGNVTSFPL